MSAPRITDEALKKTIALVAEHGGQTAAALATGVALRTIQHHMKWAAERGQLGYRPVLSGFRVSRTATTFDGAGNVTAETIQQKPELGETFVMPEGQIIKGISALVDADGREIQKWIKTKTDDVTPHLVAALKILFERYDGLAPLAPVPEYTDNRLLSMYPIADQHNGLLAWGRETGDSYDLAIGAKRLRTSMSRLVAQSPPSKQAVILNLGDWQHTDDGKNMTPRGGNLLDVDSRYTKILVCGVQLMMDCIDLALQKHENVLVRNIPGNHDPHASVALTVALSAFYSSNPRVKIDLDPSDWWFYRWGQTLIGATHGHKAKADAMAMAMAVRCREDWGATRYHWFLHGHFHHESAKECGDVRVEGFQTIASNDAHSHGAAYSSGGSLMSITLDLEDGELGRHRINIPPGHTKTEDLRSFGERIAA